VEEREGGGRSRSEQPATTSANGVKVKKSGRKEKEKGRNRLFSAPGAREEVSAQRGGWKKGGGKETTMV